MAGLQRRCVTGPGSGPAQRKRRARGGRAVDLALRYAMAGTGMLASPSNGSASWVPRYNILGRIQGNPKQPSAVRPEDAITVELASKRKRSGRLHGAQARQLEQDPGSRLGPEVADAGSPVQRRESACLPRCLAGDAPSVHGGALADQLLRGQDRRELSIKSPEVTTPAL